VSKGSGEYVVATKVELAPLTGLRFIAAFSILFGHTIAWCVQFRDNQAFHNAGAFVGVYGMPLFFVLSGFVIHYNYGKLFRKAPYAVALREFFAARFARIYPLYFFFFVFGVISDFMVNWVHEVPRSLASYIVHSLTLTQDWVYKLTINQHLLLANGFGLSWSISCEFFFYLAYAMFVFAILTLSRPGRGLAVLGLYSAAVVGALTLVFLNLDGVLAFFRAHWSNFIPVEENQDSSFYRWFFYYSPYVRIWEFVLGCLTAQLFLVVQDRPISGNEAACANILLYLALALAGAFGLAHTFHLGPPLFVSAVQFFALNFGCAIPIAIIIFCTSRYRSIIAAFLSLPWIVWLGDISYSIYAVHTWTLRPFIRPPTDFTLPTAVDGLFRIAFSVAFTIIVASATYRIIEVPCRTYLRKRLIRRDPVALVLPQPI
jgi:peptidoglycan/LPS O-acetylase OafA/YrhL